MLNPVKNLMKDNELEGSVSVISDEITITGTVTSSGNLIINGNVDGEINCESLEIGPSGVVTGTVKAGPVSYTHLRAHETSCDLV